MVRFSDATSKLISNYIAKHRLKNGEHLFGTFGKDGKMSATIAAWLVEAGIKDGKVQGQTKTPGAINLLRHAYISQKIKEEDVMKLSETMKHSPLATELYVRTHLTINRFGRTGFDGRTRSRTNSPCIST